MKTREEKVKAAEVALNALNLNATTQADRARLSAVRIGLIALDEEQAALKDRIDRLRAALKEHEPKPVWRECLCLKIAKSDRPCIICEARAQWLEDRGLPPRLTGAENDFLLRQLKSDPYFNAMLNPAFPKLTSAGLLGGARVGWETDPVFQRAVMGKAGQPVCSTCNDTHMMPLGERSVPCTRCPSPCQKCRVGGIGAYCEKTPCPCTCHRQPLRRKGR